MFEFAKLWKVFHSVLDCDRRRTFVGKHEVVRANLISTEFLVPLVFPFPPCKNYESLITKQILFVFMNSEGFFFDTIKKFLHLDFFESKEYKYDSCSNFTLKYIRYIPFSFSWLFSLDSSWHEWMWNDHQNTFLSFIFDKRTLFTVRNRCAPLST